MSKGLSLERVIRLYGEYADERVIYVYLRGFGGVSSVAANTFKKKLSRKRKRRERKRHQKRGKS